ITNDLVPTASAGSDAEICVTNGSYTFSGTTSSNGTIAWTTSGTGGFNDATIDNPTYTPSTDDNTAGSVTLTKTVTTAFGICADASDDMVLTITPTPVFSPVPSDIAVCSGELIDIDFSTLSGNDDISWTSDNTSVGNPSSGSESITFIAGSNNTTSDIVTTITVSASNAVCTSPTTTSFTITLNPTPDILSFLSPVEVCENETAVDLTSLGLSANIGGGEFTFAGSGVNSSAKTFDATTVPLGVQEIAVTYTTLEGCSKTEEINLLDVIAEPTAVAGIDDEVCENTSFTVTDASATNSAGILWSTSGAGIISNETTLNPTYTPDPSDAGTDVTLTLTVEGFSACASATDSKVLTITPEPIAEAGAATAETCVNSAFQVTDASTTNENTFSWAHDGNGSL
ncbi:hypothetical protein, partial [Marivirga sp.]|uniref:hypothetical protein n=1 Tax=Marivirga sp. TaxID=2018662 RepID=UPI003DA72D35